MTQVSTNKETWQEIQEITVLENGLLISSLDKLIGVERLLAYPHPFGRPVLFDYKISLDGGVTYYPPHNIPSINAGDHIRMFTDDGFIYFDYYNAGGGSATQITFRYRLYVVEVK